MDWNDLNIVIALSETGTLKLAAERLGKNSATIWRRVQTLEKELDCQLFLTGRSGYQLTDTGIDVIEHARNISAHVDAILSKTSAAHFEIKGLIRITAPGSIAWNILPGVISRFRAQHPEVTFEVVEQTSSLNLTRREADIALRTTNTPPEDLIARRISSMHWVVYGHPDLVNGRELCFEQLKNEPLIAYTGVEVPAVKWFQNQMGTSNISPIRCNTVATAHQCALHQQGFVLLPQSENWQLTEVARLPDEFASTLWLLAHPEMRNAARIKAFWDFILNEIEHTDLLSLM